MEIPNLLFISHVASHHRDSKRGCSARSRPGHLLYVHTHPSHCRACNTTCFAPTISWLQHPEPWGHRRLSTGSPWPRGSLRPPSPFPELRGGSELGLTWFAHSAVSGLLRWAIPPDWPPLWASFLLEEEDRKKEGALWQCKCHQDLGLPRKPTSCH